MQELERCKGHTQKGHREKRVLNVRIFQGVFRVFSGCFHREKGIECHEFQDFSGCFRGVFIGKKVLNVMNFRVFSGCFRGVFPCALSGYALWTLSNEHHLVDVPDII